MPDKDLIHYLFNNKYLHKKYFVQNAEKIMCIANIIGTLIFMLRGT